MINAPTTLLATSVIVLLVHIFIQSSLATKDLGVKWNASARDDSNRPLSLFAKRAARASANFRETYPAFLALMTIALFQPVNIMLVVTGGSIWIVARIVYIPLYLLGIPYLRSLVWLVSIVGLLVMLSSLFYEIS